MKLTTNYTGQQTVIWSFASRLKRQTEALPSGRWLRICLPARETQM